MASALCNKRELGVGNVARCELKKGHRGPHEADLGNGVVTWGEDFSDARPRRRVSGSSLPADTQASILAETFTDGIKADRISNQILVEGHAHCVKCGTSLNSRAIDVPVNLSSGTVRSLVAILLEEAMHNSVKHHTDRRRGHGYAPAKYGSQFGHDAPFLIEAPMCEVCHTGEGSEVHPGLAFGGRS